MQRAPRLTWKRLTGPALEPVTLDEAKAFARVDTAYDDTTITSFIKAAREHCQAITGRQFITATFALLLDEFPSWFRFNTYHGSERANGTDILLPWPSLVSVESVTYTDENSVAQTVAAADYVVSTFDEPGRVTLAYGKSWPSTLEQINAVRVDYTAGYGVAASSVPESIKQAMRMLIAHWYQNREATDSAATLPKAIDFAVRETLRPYTVAHEWVGSLE